MVREGDEAVCLMVMRRSEYRTEVSFYKFYVLSAYLPPELPTSGIPHNPLCQPHFKSMWMYSAVLSDLGEPAIVFTTRPDSLLAWSNLSFPWSVVICSKHFRMSIDDLAHGHCARISAIATPFCPGFASSY